MPWPPPAPRSADDPGHHQPPSCPGGARGQRGYQRVRAAVCVPEEIPMRLIAEDAPPLMNAGGMVKTLEDFIQAHAAPTGAVLAGSYTIEERAGNPGGTYLGTDHYSINAMGLPGPALDTWT